MVQIRGKKVHENENAWYQFRVQSYSVRTQPILLGVIPEFPETSKIASYLRSNHKGIKTRIQFISRETELFDRVSKYGSGHDLVASIREHFDASDECRFY